MRKINLDNTPDPVTFSSLDLETKNVVDEIPISDNNDSSMKSPLSKLVLIFSIIAVVGGIGTGYGGFKLKTKSADTKPAPSDLQRIAETGQIKAGDIFGVKDEKTFKDSAQGYLEIGGIDGEGSHKIIRPGGVSQTVYLTSSITDLDKFAGMDVKIWGETFKGQNAGWLMDVGRIEILNPEGSAPSEE